MTPFVTVTGAAIPFAMDDVNTDQIIPASYLKDLHADMSAGFLAYMRRNPDGTRISDFVLEQPQFQAAPIMVVGSNFGCGSSREHAVWALQAFGVRCVIGHRLSEFFYDNCLKNGVLPVELDQTSLARLMQACQQSYGHDAVTVDLQACEIRGPKDFRISFTIRDHQRIALLEGLDDIGLTMRHLDLIETWEKGNQVKAA